MQPVMMSNTAFLLSIFNEIAKILPESAPPA